MGVKQKLFLAGSSPFVASGHLGIVFEYSMPMERYPGRHVFVDSMPMQRHPGRHEPLPYRNAPPPYRIEPP